MNTPAGASDTAQQIAASDVHDWDGTPDTPKWHDIYTEAELAAALRYTAARLAKRDGAYELASELNLAADCIEDLAERDAGATHLTDAMALGTHPQCHKP